MADSTRRPPISANARRHVPPLGWPIRFRAVVYEAAESSGLVVLNRYPRQIVGIAIRLHERRYLSLMWAKPAAGHPVAEPDSDGALLARMGVDAAKWTDEFMKRVDSGMVVDWGVMVAWFANAIETGRAANSAPGAGEPR